MTLSNFHSLTEAIRFVLVCCHTIFVNNAYRSIVHIKWIQIMCEYMRIKEQSFSYSKKIHESLLLPRIPLCGWAVIREEKIRFLAAVEWIGVIFHKSHFPPTTRQRSGQFFCSSSLVIIASFSFVQPLSAFFSQLSMIQWFNDCWWSSRGPLLQIIPSSWKQLVPTIYLVITSSDHLRARGWIAAAPHIFEPRDHQQQMLYFHHVFCFPLPQTHF